MKTLLTSLLAILVIASASTQTKEDNAAHMTFKGVPIDGTLNEYVAKMKEAGFTHIGTENGFSILKGDFATYKNCTIGVSTLKGKDLVSSITVMFPKKETWTDLAGDYYTLKELLTEKYGEPSDVKENFESTIQPDDDFDKMHEVGMNNCKYYTIFITNLGRILLSIDHDGFSKSFIRLSYSDKINSQIIREKALGDL